MKSVKSYLIITSICFVLIVVFFPFSTVSKTALIGFPHPVALLAFMGWILYTIFFIFQLLGGVVKKNVKINKPVNFIVRDIAIIIAALIIVFIGFLINISL